MRAIVLFDTRYGNTEKIARSLEAGLGSAGLETACEGVKGANADSLDEYDLVCVGGPTEWHSASRGMKSLLERLDKASLRGKYGFAFDTKLDTPLSGAASGVIEKKLKKTGLKIIAPRESAIVSGVKGTAGAQLKEGEEQRFERVGALIGAALSQKKDIPTR